MQVISSFDRGIVSSRLVVVVYVSRVVCFVYSQVYVCDVRMPWRLLHHAHLACNLYMCHQWTPHHRHSFLAH